VVLAGEEGRGQPSGRAAAQDHDVSHVIVRAHHHLPAIMPV
jgi:hypothetical protein